MRAEDQFRITIATQRQAFWKLADELDLGLSSDTFEAMFGVDEGIFVHPRLGIIWALPYRDDEGGQCGQCICSGNTCPQRLDGYKGPGCTFPERKDRRDVTWTDVR